MASRKERTVSMSKIFCVRKVVVNVYVVWPVLGNNLLVCGLIVNSWDDLTVEQNIRGFLKTILRQKSRKTTGKFTKNTCQVVSTTFLADIYMTFWMYSIRDTFLDVFRFRHVKTYFEMSRFVCPYKTNKFKIPKTWINSQFWKYKFWHLHLFNN